MNNINIVKLDNKGRGICYIDSKITFVENALPNEIVNIKIVKETKKYNEAIVLDYVVKSPKRLDSLCPYFNFCGGCDLLNMSYDDTISFKKNKLEEILLKYANIKTNIDIIKNPSPLNYRNKITLKIVSGNYGFYQSSSHNLIKVDNCLLASLEINEFIKDLKYIKINNGEITIRSNYNQELLIWIKTEDKVNIDLNYLKSHHKIAGIILNDEVINGDSKFIEIINNIYFTVSYDSFFQVNRYICSLLFNELKDYINKDEIILDLYCGVGTLGISIAKYTKKIYGIEVVKNAILNAISNVKINKISNAYYMLGKVSDIIPKIKDEITTIIVDPPRAGLDSKTLKNIINISPSKIIYISCDPITLARDLKELKEYYDIKSIKGLDMFSYTYHVETFCVLNKK